MNRKHPHHKPPRRGTDRARYESWVHEYADDLHRLAYRLCGDAATAEELVQETFYHAWKDMRKLRSAEKARPWLLQILRHRYAHWIRDTQRRPPSTESPDTGVTDTPGPADQVTERDALQVALNTLEDRFKLPLLLVFLGGMTCQQAAEHLDLPLGTVLSRIHRGRQHLRRAIEAGTDRRSSTSTRPDPEQPRLRLRLGGES